MKTLTPTSVSIALSRLYINPGSHSMSGLRRRIKRQANRAERHTARQHIEEQLRDHSAPYVSAWAGDANGEEV